ncbi:MAG: ABC transporter substrate-binding protein [Candidatus Promineifilaceae bacterium]
MKNITLFLLCILLLVGCGPSESAAPVVEELEPIEESTDAPEPAEEPTEAPEPTEGSEPTAESKPTTDPEPTAEPTEEAVVAPEVNFTEGCVDAYDEAVDYFPQKTTISAAQGFTVEYHNNYKVVTVLTPFSGAEAPAQYVLVQCGTPAPESIEDATVIEVPISSIVAMSTTYLPALELIDRVDALVAVDTGLYASSEAVTSRIAAGEVTEIGSGAEVNIEMAIELEPDVIMTGASGLPEYDAHPKLQEAGLTVVLNADYLDATPLGRAEWADFVALFFNEEAAAEAQYAKVATNYAELAALVADVEERPTVFANTPFDGTWYMPGGQGYVAQLLADAGADYLWAGSEGTNSLFLDFETVFDTAAAADAWIHIGFFGTLDDLLAADERHAEFAAFQSGSVFNNDVRTTVNGGNDYYESGAIAPDVVLADMIKIFHPELLPDHELVYHRAVE